MFLTYLRRELDQPPEADRHHRDRHGARHRPRHRRQLVAAGVQNAQSSVLESVYGVGTDITVTQTAEPGADERRAGQRSTSARATADRRRQHRRSPSRASRPPAARHLRAADLDHRRRASTASAAATAPCAHEQELLGQLPDFPQAQDAARRHDGTGTGPALTPTGGQPAPHGRCGRCRRQLVRRRLVHGPGLDPSRPTRRPAHERRRSPTAAPSPPTTRAPTSSCSTPTYATSDELAVGDTLDIGGTDFTVVGIVASTASDATTASERLHPPRHRAGARRPDRQDQRRLRHRRARATSTSPEDRPAGRTARRDREHRRPTSRRASPARCRPPRPDRRSSAPGSRSSCSPRRSSSRSSSPSRASPAAPASSAPSRRSAGATRRITRQVAGESLVQGLVGGVVGVAAGLVGLLVVNLVAPTLSAAATSTAAAGPGGGAGGPGAAADAGGAAAAAAAASASRLATATTDVVLHAPVTISVVAARGRPGRRRRAARRRRGRLARVAAAPGRGAEERRVTGATRPTGTVAPPPAGTRRTHRPDQRLRRHPAHVHAHRRHQDLLAGEEDRHRPRRGRPRDPRRARWSRSRARPEAASRPCCRCSARSTGRRAARCGSATPTSRRRATARWPRCGPARSASCSRAST